MRLARVVVIAEIIAMPARLFQGGPGLGDGYGTTLSTMPAGTKTHLEIQFSGTSDSADPHRL
jgi:hypothetical protein